MRTKTYSERINIIICNNNPDVIVIIIKAYQYLVSVRISVTFLSNLYSDECAVMLTPCFVSDPIGSIIVLLIHFFPIII